MIGREEARHLPLLKTNGVIHHSDLDRMRRAGQTVNTLKLPKSSYYLLCLLAAALILAMTPLVATAATFPVAANGSDFFFPDGESGGQTFTINVGDDVL